jgi:hypothetical protein
MFLFRKKVKKSKYNIGQLVACKVAYAGLTSEQFPTVLGVIRKVEPLKDSFLYTMDWFTNSSPPTTLPEKYMNEITKMAECLKKVG